MPHRADECQSNPYQQRARTMTGHRALPNSPRANRLRPGRILGSFSGHIRRECPNVFRTVGTSSDAEWSCRHWNRSPAETQILSEHAVVDRHERFVARVIRPCSPARPNGKGVTELACDSPLPPLSPVQNCFRASAQFSAPTGTDSVAPYSKTRRRSLCPRSRLAPSIHPDL